jgi:hypothetical protein
MIEVRYGTLGGLQLPVQVYETFAEAEALVIGGLLKAANSSLAYRGPLNPGRELVCDILEEKTLVARKMFLKDGKTETDDVAKCAKWENPEAFGRRVAVAQGLLKDDGSPDFTRFQDILDVRARAYPNEFNSDGTVKVESGYSPLAVDVTERVREPAKPKTIPDKILAKATLVYDGTNRDRFIALIASKLGITLTVTGDRDADIKRFAYAALDADRKARAEAAAEQEKSLFGS